MLERNILRSAFVTFSAWARNNTVKLNKWAQLHKEPWILHAQRGGAQRPYVFSIESLDKERGLSPLSQEIRISEEDLRYTLDHVLRLPIYGALAGETEPYSNHPIRDAFPLPTMTPESGILPRVAISFEHLISKLAPKLSQEEYTLLLHELRGIVRERELYLLKPHNVDRETVREIASRVKLPPRINKFGKSVAIVAAILGGFGASASWVRLPPFWAQWLAWGLYFGRELFRDLPPEFDGFDGR